MPEFLKDLFINEAKPALDRHSGNDSGGNVDYVGVEPAEDDIPKVYFTGTLPTSKAEDDVKLTMHYISKTADFIYPVTLKVQGATSTSYPKKNFTLKPYKDSTYEKKQKLVFKNWPEMNKFVLKAHWIDHSHVRNVGTAKIWSKIVKSRSDYDRLPEELRNAPNNGATDGFTVKVFANGVYQGLYEWIVPKDKLFGQDSDIATHSILNSELNNQPTCAFATTSPTVGGNWSEELQDSMSNDISTSFANLIKFVAGSTDEEFVANAENYFDVQSVIDYNIFARVFCIVDNLCRNQIFFTYDGMKWYEGAWDLDAVLGLPPLAYGFFHYDTEFQTGYVSYKESGLINLLYQRVETLFMERFKARYAELRSGVLTIENILGVYERLTDVITTYDGLLAEDFASTTGDGAFVGIPYRNENNIRQIRAFVSKRIPYMDGIIDAMTVPVPCTGISLSTSKLTFTAEGNQTLTAILTPDGCTDAVTWESNNTSIATVDNGVVTAVANGNATITAKCGAYSATCAVSVSGLKDIIACTGITFDKTELTFNNVGTQTITASVVPVDTTDGIVWASSNPNVAYITVDGNVCTVQSISEGNTTITATCGNYSASCMVTVNSIGENATGILEGCTFGDGCIIGNTGQVASGKSDKHSSEITISDYRGKWISVSMQYPYDITHDAMSRLAFYDSEMNFISSVSSKKVDSTNRLHAITACVPDNAAYMRISVYIAAAANSLPYFTVYAEDKSVNLYTEDTQQGKYYETNDGSVSSNASVNSALIPVSGCEFITMVNIRGYVSYDSENNMLQSAWLGTAETANAVLLHPDTVNVGFNRTVNVDGYGVYVGKEIGTMQS